jgi:hypothetical protein
MSRARYSVAVIVGLCVLLAAAEGVSRGLLFSGAASGGGAVSSFTGAADIVASPTLCYSDTACSNALLGTKMSNWIRASDSHTCDVLSDPLTGYFGKTANCVPSGDNNTTFSSGVGGWCNATTCSKVTWYNQSGTGPDLTQATAAQRPTLVNTVGGTHSCGHWASASTQQMSATISAVSEPYSLSVIAEKTGIFTTYTRLFNATPLDAFYNPVDSTSGKLSINLGDTITSAPPLASYQAVYNGASSVVARDNAETTYTSSGAATGTTLYIGVYSNGSTHPFEGNICEFVIWPTALNSTQRTNLDANQHTRFFIGGGDVFGTPAASAGCDGTFTLSNSNKTATTTGGSNDACFSNTTFRSAGKWYFEAAITAGGTAGSSLLGIADPAFTGALGVGPTSIGLFPDTGGGQAVWKSAGTNTNVGVGNGCYAAGPSTGTWGFRVDMDAHTIACTNNGSTFSSNYSWTPNTNGPALAAPVIQGNTNGYSVTLNTGNTAFTYSIPVGFTKWCSGWTC